MAHVSFAQAAPPVTLPAPAIAQTWEEATSYAMYKLVTAEHAALFTQTPIGIAPKSKVYRNGLLCSPGYDITLGNGNFTALYADAGDLFTIVTDA